MFPAPPNVGNEELVKFVRSSRHTDLSVRPDHTKIILCAGVFPSTTLVLNSFQHLEKTVARVNNTVTGHFLTHLVGRVKRSAFKDLKEKSLEMGAEYLSVKHPQSKLQYHIQVTAIASPVPEQDAEDAARFYPVCKLFVIYVCTLILELLSVPMR